MPPKDHVFKAPLIRPEGTGTWTYVEVPEKVSKAFGMKGRAPIRGTIAGIEFRGSLMPGGEGRHFIVVAKPIREAAAVTTGDTVEVRVQADTGERTVELPAELVSALEEDATARETFEALAYSHRKEYATWVAEAKRAETRTARAAKALGLLREGRKLKA